MADAQKKNDGTLNGVATEKTTEKITEKTTEKILHHNRTASAVI